MHLVTLWNKWLLENTSSKAVYLIHKAIESKLVIKNQPIKKDRINMYKKYFIMSSKYSKTWQKTHNSSIFAEYSYGEYCKYYANF